MVEVHTSRCQIHYLQRGLRPSCEGLEIIKYDQKSNKLTEFRTIDTKAGNKWTFFTGRLYEFCFNLPLNSQVSWERKYSNLWYIQYWTFVLKVFFCGLKDLNKRPLPPMIHQRGNGRHTCIVVNDTCMCLMAGNLSGRSKRMRQMEFLLIDVESILGTPCSVVSFESTGTMCGVIYFYRAPSIMKSYNTETNKWSDLSKPKLKGSYGYKPSCKLFASKNKLYATVAGEDPHCDLYKYDAKSDLWNKVINQLYIQDPIGILDNNDNFHKLFADENTRGETHGVAKTVEFGGEIYAFLNDGRFGIVAPEEECFFTSFQAISESYVHLQTLFIADNMYRYIDFMLYGLMNSFILEGGYLNMFVCLKLSARTEWWKHNTINLNNTQESYYLVSASRYCVVQMGVKVCLACFKHRYVRYVMMLHTHLDDAISLRAFMITGISSWKAAYSPTYIYVIPQKVLCSFLIHFICSAIASNSIKVVHWFNPTNHNAHWFYLVNMLFHSEPVFVADVDAAISPFIVIGSLCRIE